MYKVGDCHLEIIRQHGYLLLDSCVPIGELSVTADFSFF
jgi:hypothetical protein